MLTVEDADGVLSTYEHVFIICPVALYGLFVSLKRWSDESMFGIGVRVFSFSFIPHFISVVVQGSLRELHITL